MWIDFRVRNVQSEFKSNENWELQDEHVSSVQFERLLQLLPMTAVDVQSIMYTHYEWQAVNKCQKNSAK